jgi:beta-1,4-mannosyl-glycoprotein beta-1,4-N-acetylglucosaminyltransferase
MRVFDCFPLFNEIDLLELRLNELWDVVDIFVIVEAKKTFTGKSKPMCLPDHEERLAKYLHKIRYVVVEDFPEGMSNWGKEEYQRNAIKKDLADVLPDDILIFSDLDEIPRAKVVQSIVENGIKPKEVYCLSLDWYSFYLNIKISEKWERQGPRMIRAGGLSELYSLRRVMAPTRGWGRDMMRQIKSSWRMGHWVKRIRVPDAGWHFTWMGGKEAVALKGSSLPVHSNLPEGEKSLAWADARISTLLEDGSRYAVVEVDDSFPSFVRDNLDIFEKHILRKAP